MAVDNKRFRTTKCLSAYERDSVTRIHKNKLEWEKICPTNQRLFSDFLLYISIGNYTYQTCLTIKASIYLFLLWNTQYNENTTFFSMKKIHFSRFFNYLLEQEGYSYDRVRIIKSHLCTMSDFAEHILGFYEYMPNGRGDRNKWYRFKNIVKDVEIGDEPDRIRQCNIDTFDKEDIERLEWFLKEIRNYEAIVVLHFCRMGVDILNLTIEEVEEYNNKLCNRWVKFIRNYNLPFNNAIVTQIDRRVWRVATKEDLAKYEELFTTFLGRKFIIC